MNATNAKKEVYAQIESLLLRHQKQIISTLIEKGCRPGTADKVSHEIWREMFDKKTKQPAIRLCETEKRMLAYCVDGSDRSDYYKKAAVKRGEKLAKLGYLDTEAQEGEYGQWIKYTTTEAGKEQIERQRYQRIAR